MIYKVNARGPTGNNILQTERIVLASLLNHVSDAIYSEVLSQASIICDEDNLAGADDSGETAETGSPSLRSTKTNLKSSSSRSFPRFQNLLRFQHTFT